MTYRTSVLPVLALVLLPLAGAAQEPKGPVAALRLVVEYREGIFYLNQALPLRVVLPDSDPEPVTDAGEPQAGFWIELQSDSGGVLYRRVMSDPLVRHSETLDPATGELRREEFIPAEQHFSILVPAPATDGRVVFFSSALGNLPTPSGAATAAIEAARTRGARAVGFVKVRGRRRFWDAD